MTLGAQIAFTGLLLFGIPFVMAVALSEPGKDGATHQLIGEASLCGTVASVMLLVLSMIWGF